VSKHQYWQGGRHGRQQASSCLMLIVHTVSILLQDAGAGDSLAGALRSGSAVQPHWSEDRQIGIMSRVSMC
jgi:hypothetical protein